MILIKLIAKYQPGQTFKGQQGVTQPVNSNFGAPGTTEFTLLDNEHNRRATGVTAPDDTRDVERHMHAPRGPRVDRYTPRSAPMYESFRTGGTSNGGRAANVTANEREIERATKRANVALDY